MFIISVIVMFIISWDLTLVMVAPLPILVLLILPCGNKVRTISKERQDKISDANSWSEECFSNIRTLKSFGNEYYSHVI